MATSFLSGYSTSSGDAYGYNERAGTNTGVLRDRYENSIYRGSRTDSFPSVRSPQAARPETSPSRSVQFSTNGGPPSRGLQQIRAPSPRSMQAQPRTVESASFNTNFNPPRPQNAYQPNQYQPNQYQQPRRSPHREMKGNPNASGYGRPVPPIDNRRNPSAYQYGGFRNTVEMPRTTNRMPLTRGARPRMPTLAGDPLNNFRARGSGTYSPDNRTCDSLGPLGDIFNSRRPPTPEVSKPRLSYEKEQGAMNYGKLSISRRLPEKERLRYHIPGYMGFVRRQQFHHGETFGTTTRKCILGYSEDSTPLI